MDSVLYSMEGVISGVGRGVGVGLTVGEGVAATTVGVGATTAGGILLGRGAVTTELEKTSDIYTSSVFIKSILQHPSLHMQSAQITVYRTSFIHGSAAYSNMQALF